MENNTESAAVPSYLIAGSAHSIASGEESLTDTITKGAPAALISGGVQLLNILPTVGNWVGGDFKQIKTSEVMQSFDNDLGKYYEHHQEGIDALGFVISSLVPGSFGVKALRSGQAILSNAIERGVVGETYGRALGLLAPSQPKLLSAAVEAAVRPNAGFPIWNANTVKAIAAGFGQSALEGAAFETAVAATMYNSPVLQNQDFGDIVSNIVHSSAAFGVLGGVLGSAVTYHQIKSAGRLVDKELTHWNQIIELPKASTADQILNYFEQKHQIIPPEKSMFSVDKPWMVNKALELAEKKTQYLDTKIRSLFGSLTGDEKLAEKLFEQARTMPMEQLESKLFSTTEAVRLGAKTEYEKLVAKTIAPKNSTLDVSDVLKLPDREIVYLNLKSGLVSPEAPQILHIADNLEPGQLYEDVIKAAKQTPKVNFDAAATTYAEAEARYVTAAGHSFADDTVLNAKDIPYLQAAYLKGAWDKVSVSLEDGSKYTFTSKEDLGRYLIQLKQEAQDTLTRKGKVSVDYAAKVTDTTPEFVTGLVHEDLESAAFVTRTNKQWESPTVVKLVKDTTPVKDIDGNVVKGLVAIKEKQRLFEDAADRATAEILEDYEARIFRLTDTDVNKANRSGPGGGVFTAQNENYGTLGSKVQQLGALTLKLINKKHDSLRAELDPLLYQLAQNPEAAIEWSVLNARLRSLGEVYAYDAEQQAMRPLRLIKYERAGAKGELPQFKNIADEDLFIPINNQETIDLIEAHTARNAERLGQLKAIRSNQGVNLRRNAEGFYPIPANTKDYPFFGFVIDDSISGAGHSKMIYAATSSDLEAQITAIKAQDPTLKIITKKEAETWYKSIGQFDFERTLTDTAFDAGLKMKGTSANYLPATDPKKIVEDTLNWHLQRETNLVREAVLHKNANQVATLRTLGEQYASVQGSHFSKLDPLSYVELQEKNPYGDYVKTMLGLHTNKDFPFWSPINEMLDRKVSGLFNSVYEMFSQAKSTKDLETINSHLRAAGYNGVYDGVMNAFANHSAPKGALAAFVAKANALLSSTMLGLDPINALTNFVGSNVLRSTELQSLLRAIKEGNANLAGDLAYIKVPGTGDLLQSPVKMLAKALKDFHSSEGTVLRDEFKTRGIITSRVDQTKWVLDNLALTGKETVAELESKIDTVFSGVKKLAAKGEIVTGNALAEEVNRFVSGHVAKQITDVAVAQGLLGEKEAWAYVNTFVNRVEGNYIAAQRPGVFQGPLGQAMGLFQTYQFNLMQQLLRHVGEGSSKDVALMMGLQSTIFGLKGLPAFDAINTHIIGTASGNTNHRDLYDTVFGAAGKDAGEWLMYGAGSNALGLLSPDLKFNLYTRGDINPRNVTLLPINPANIPFIQATGKLYSSLKETFEKSFAGGNVWEAMLQGAEHAGVSRPLTGLAQVLQSTTNPERQVFSTSNKGNVIASHDLMTWASFVRLAGAKPLDEAIGIDRAYQVEAYAAKDASLRSKLGEAIKTTVIAGQNPTQDQIDNFAEKYAKYGGQQDKFAQFMMQQYKNANTSQVNKLADNLKSPFSQSMQTIMGGYYLRDFNQ